jgi:hypothetical protein
LARHQCLNAGGFDLVEMHKNIGAAIIRQDEDKAVLPVIMYWPAPGLDDTRLS